MGGLRDGFAAWRERRRRARRRARLLAKADAVVVSYRKSGRTWLRAMLSHLYHERYGLPADLLLDGENLSERDPRAPCVLFTHDDAAEPWNGRLGGGPVRALGGKRVVFLARDPRDVAVSSYHHLRLRASPDERALEGLAPTGEPPPLHEYVAPADGRGGKARDVVRHLNRWAEILPRLPLALLVTYEEMRADPEGALRRVAAFVDGSADAGDVRGAVAFASFESLREKERAGFFESFRLRPADAADPDSFKVRRGRVGGYRDELTPEQADRLDAVVAAELSPFWPYARSSPVGAADAGEAPGARPVSAVWTNGPGPGRAGSP